MKITQLLKRESILLSGKKDSKENTINTLVDLMQRGGNLNDAVLYKKDVLKREEEGTTGIGEGIAIPHAKSSGVKSAGLAAMVVKEGTDYDSLDGEPSKLFFNIAVPKDSNDEHLSVLSRLSTMLMDEDFREKLINANDVDEFLRLIDIKEREKFPEDFKGINVEQKSGVYDIIAVTACPTGIAHTYMAQEALMNKAKEMGYTIKVETDGSTGVENKLTKEDIENAKAVIIAADKNVDKARFSGKKLVETKVADGIHKPKELIEKALSDKATVYNSKENTVRREDGLDESSSHKVYKHLMNGVSHMLPFVIGGGILIALAFLIDNFAINPKNFGSNTETAAFFMKIGKAAFGFMLPVLAGYIAMSIGDRPALAVGFVGGLLASEAGAGFLGALIAGFLAGYIIILLRKGFSFLPESLNGIKPTLIFPVLGILIIGALMVFVFNKPMASITNAMTNWLNAMGSTSKILLGIILASMMAFDMGGPINKAAYVFGTATLVSGASSVMAAVMIGGMVPPLAIAFAMLIFKKKFTSNERKTIPSNIIMGLSFITEGAIPFAAKDPLRVIPACVIGAATSGALSMLFNCAIRAPHGGLWVLKVISNPTMYVVALLAGTVVSTILLGILKKDVTDKTTVNNMEVESII